jgi:hypothetical protein
MKNSTLFIALSTGLTSSAIAAWLAFGGSFPAEILFGGYTILGLFYITEESYTTKSLKLASGKPSRTWIKNSFERKARTLRPTATTLGL